MSHPLWQRVRIAVRDRDLDAIKKLERQIDEAEPPVSESEKNALSAQILMFKGEEGAARKKLISTSKKRALDVHEKLVLGLLLIEEAPKAKKLFAAAAKGGLKDPRIAEGLGATLLDMGEVEAALEQLTQAVEADDKSWSARFARGMGYVANDDTYEALADFEAVAKMRPDFEPAWLGFAAQAIKAGKAAEASQVLGPLVESTPGREKLMLAYVDCLVHAGDLSRALAAFTPLANSSRDPGLLCTYAELCLQGDFLAPAQQTLDKIEKIDAEHAYLWLLRGQLCELSEPRDVRGAITAYNKAVELDKKFIEAINALGLLLMRDTEYGDLGRAGKLLSGAAKSKTQGGAAALANLALLRLTEGKKDEAKRLASSVLKRKKASAAARAQAEKILTE